MTDIVTTRLLFTGHVQGVGFRASTAGIARRLNLDGYVRNLPDGRVEVVCRHDPDLVRQLRDGLEGLYRGYIEHTEVELQQASDGFKFSGFHIRR